MAISNLSSIAYSLSVGRGVVFQATIRPEAERLLAHILRAVPIVLGGKPEKRADGIVLGLEMLNALQTRVWKAYSSNKTGPEQSPTHRSGKSPV